MEEAIMDIHQHIFYSGRTDEQLVYHQQKMGVTKTILLPLGREVFSDSTHYGHAEWSGRAGTNRSCYNFAQSHNESFLFAANEVPDFPEAIKEIEKYLNLGGKMIAELVYGLACDSTEMQNIYKLVGEYNVPVLMHWQYGAYNYGFERFYRLLEKYHRTKFIGHAQTWWANIDKGQQDHPFILYPIEPVTLGGLTDLYLDNYENLYGDLSAGSGLNALTRDEEFTKYFFQRYQDRLMFGSDCDDSVGEGSACSGAQTLALIRKFSPKSVGQKLLFENAKGILRV